MHAGAPFDRRIEIETMSYLPRLSRGADATRGKTRSEELDQGVRSKCPERGGTPAERSARLRKVKSARRNVLAWTSGQRQTHPRLVAICRDRSSVAHAVGNRPTCFMKLAASQ
jgi:hypothetical protein